MKQDFRKNEEGFWVNLEKWRNLPRLAPFWRDGWLRNETCAQCRLCCGKQGENDKPFPMPLLPSQIDSQTPNDFYLLDSHTPFIGKDGCKSCGPGGCRLAKEKKPVACRLFPLVLVDGGLFLYTNCPAALFTPLADFMALAKEAAETLAELSLEDLQIISIHLPLEELVSKYAYLHVKIFDETGKCLLLE